MADGGRTGVVSRAALSYIPTSQACPPHAPPEGAECPEPRRLLSFQTPSSQCRMPRWTWYRGRNEGSGGAQHDALRSEVLNADVRELVAAVRSNPADAEAAAVLGDWAEEHGLDEAAAHLRTDPDGRLFLRGLATVQWLAGSAAAGRGSAISGVYEHVLKGGSIMVPACDVESVTATAIRPFRLRRFVLSRSVAPMLNVRQIMIDEATILRGGPNDSVPGELFTIDASFDLLDEEVPRGAVLHVTLENDSTRDVLVRGCFLGRSI